MLEGKHALRSGTSSRRSSTFSGGTVEALADESIGDDLLRLIFIACHPRAVDARRGSR